MLHDLRLLLGVVASLILGVSLTELVTLLSLDPPIRVV
jgi:hypothetical protein